MKAPENEQEKFRTIYVEYDKEKYTRESFQAQQSPPKSSGRFRKDSTESEDYELLEAVRS